MNVNGNFKDNLMGKKKVIFIGCGGAGYFENLTFRRTESERDFRGKRAGSGAWDETL